MCMHKDDDHEFLTWNVLKVRGKTWIHSGVS